MARIVACELRAINLPFKNAFKHAAAARKSSSSLFLKVVTDEGFVGFGECLPRPYVTGESQDSTFDLLHRTLVPLIESLNFNSLVEVFEFLFQCNGQSPKDWGVDVSPHTAAWCAIDLALLDAFGRHFKTPVKLPASSTATRPPNYSAVISSEASFKTLLQIRLAGIRQVKLKVEKNGNLTAARRCRFWLGKNCDIRVDANMAWELDEAVDEMNELSKQGIRSFEQPMAADKIAQASELILKTPGLEVMADESLHNHESLEYLIQNKACNSANIRISKCGGLVGAYRRSRFALDHGLKLQFGCQVGESSLLSAAHLLLRDSVPEVSYLEGCFGLHLLQEDPAKPIMQFGYRGNPPKPPTGPGLGVELDENMLQRYTVRREEFKFPR